MFILSFTLRQQISRLSSGFFLIVDPFNRVYMLVMDEEPIVWTDWFFSGDPPESIKGTETNSDKDFPRFFSEDEDFIVRGQTGQSKYTSYETIQVYWLWSNGYRKYVGKIVSRYFQCTSCLD